MIGPLMIDIAGTTLVPDDIELLKHPTVGGLILFSRNITSPKQVRDLTDHIHQIRPHILIAVDQEGGRVQRLKTGFSKLPPMRSLGHLYNQQPEQAITLSEHCGYLMASEVLAVGIDFSFAPVLDVDGVSQVIGDRGFHHQKNVIITLASAFMRGMTDAGMATTGKHFPGHGSTEADSHIAEPIDIRSWNDIEQHDMYIFTQLMPKLSAIMPAHVIYPKVDPHPAGFSPFWLQHILRGQLGFDGVIFSDDLSMQAACVVGHAGSRLQAALRAGCDMGLMCNDRSAVLCTLADNPVYDPPDQQRLVRMAGRIPHHTQINWQHDQLVLNDSYWATASERIQRFNLQLS